MIRTGIGYDVHQLVKGESLIIGSVKIESEIGSLGHSDGDALIHSICDALLGVASLGDIGHFFPSDNDMWKNKESSYFLIEVIRKIKKEGYSINNIDAFKKTNVIIDFTVPKCTLEILKIATKLKKRVVIGTTGFSNREENIIKKYSKQIPILKAGNMSLGVNLLMYLTEIASKSLDNNFLSKIYEVHHKHKIDYPSGTALMLGKGIANGKNKNLNNLMGNKYLNKKSFPYSKKINFNSIRKDEVIGEHEVRFSSGKEIVTLNHESFDRALYSEGALTAANWLMSKKAGLYSMRDLLNFK